MDSSGLPICSSCEGYGTQLINPITHQRSETPCDVCGGQGRVNPAPPYAYDREAIIKASEEAAARRADEEAAKALEEAAKTKPGDANDVPA